MANIDDVIRVANAELGYLEKKTNDCLDDKLANAGVNNFTKYGKAQGCNGQAWCGAFVDWCFIQAYGKNEANRLICGFSNYTPTMASYFKQRGLFVKSAPQKGDVIFFKNSERICHTGIVIKVDKTKVYTIEGNTSAGANVIPNGGGVCSKFYLLTNSRIAGYGRPNYTNTGAPILYKGCIGIAVKEMQRLMNKKHPNGKITEDGDFGVNTFNRLVEIQALYDIPKTGMCGSKMWDILYN